MNLSFRTAARIAWRETRSSTAKFVFVILAVAAGVGALSGVRGFSESVRTMLARESRSIMAADLTARQFVNPSGAQLAELDRLGSRGVDRTLITETVSMASSGAPDATPALVSVKAVDPAKYPYYGQVKLRPPQGLKEALAPDTLVAGEDVLIRLGARTGDKIKLGDEEFRVAAIVDSEPDRMSGSLNVGLRIMMSREAFERSGLMKVGSRAAERYLFKIEPGGPAVEEARAAIKSALPEALVADSTQTHPLITRGLNQATTFLSLVSLIALIVGAIGVGMAMHAHLQQKMDNIAVMKSLGGTSREIIRIYMLQTLLLGIAGGLAGVAAGRGVEEIFPHLINRIFEIRADVRWHASAALQGIVAGILTTLLFTLPPLLAIRKVRPALILRRDMPDVRRDWRARLRNARSAVGVGVLILAGIGGIAAWLAGSARVGGYFAGGLVVSLLVLAVVSWGLLRILRVFLNSARFRLGSLTRQGLANLQRQGNQAQAILVALGLGVMFTLSVYLLQNSLVDDLIQTAPPGVPNVFLIGVTPTQVEPLKELIRKQPGVESAPELDPSVAARLVAINGAPFMPGNTPSPRRRFAATRSVTWNDQQPANTTLTEGQWWKKDMQEPVVAVQQDAAEALALRPGSTVEFDASGQRVLARVVAVHQFSGMRSAGGADFVFNRSALEGLPVVYYGGVHVKPSAVGGLQRAVFDKFPTITVVNIADVLEVVQQIIDQIALVIRFLSGFAILAGAIILSASVAGTRFRRIREVVILKTLGGTRRHVRRIFSIEFLTLGAVAGLMGGLLANGFSRLVLERLIETRFQFNIWVVVAAVMLTALLANVAGWLASFRILGQKPLEALREE
jgi:putative ABC transport system permease protein